MCFKIAEIACYFYHLFRTVQGQIEFLNTDAEVIDAGFQALREGEFEISAIVDFRFTHDHAGLVEDDLVEKYLHVLCAADLTTNNRSFDPIRI